MTKALCTPCKGTGKIVTSHGSSHTPRETQCPACKGKGST